MFQFGCPCRSLICAFLFVNWTGTFIRGQPLARTSSVHSKVVPHAARLCPKKGQNSLFPEFAPYAFMDVSHFNGRNTIFTLLVARWSKELDHVLKWFCRENVYLGFVSSFGKLTLLLCLMFHARQAMWVSILLGHKPTMLHAMSRQSEKPMFK